MKYSDEMYVQTTEEREPTDKELHAIEYGYTYFDSMLGEYIYLSKDDKMMQQGGSVANRISNYKRKK